MEKSNQIDKKVTKTTSLSITGSQQGIDLGSNIWAVNWFNPKRRWLYNLYTTLAGPLVIKVGGRLWHKSTFLEKLAGKDDDGRNMLLIVEYPTASNFMDLVGIKFFQLISILRILAVEDFIFGFTKRVAVPGLTKNRQAKGAPCLIHHFRSKKNFSGGFNSLASFASDKGINLIYAGTKVATLSRTIVDKGVMEVPFFMDGIIVFESDNIASLKTFFGSETYRDFTSKTENSYAAIFEKIA